MNKNAVKNKTVHRRKMNFLGFCLATFGISASLYFVSSLFLRSYNNSLSTTTQSITTQIAALETQNDAVQVEIETLSSSNRVEGIAANSGMTRNQDAIFTLTNGAQ